MYHKSDTSYMIDETYYNTKLTTENYGNVEVDEIVLNGQTVRRGWLIGDSNYCKLQRTKILIRKKTRCMTVCECNDEYSRYKSHANRVNMNETVLVSRVKKTRRVNKVIFIRI